MKKSTSEGEAGALVAPRPALLTIPAAILGFGFLALVAFWLAGNPRPGVPGLFDYAAATIGDGLLLPTLALLCVLALATVSMPAPDERRWALVGSLAGIALGSLLQALWLLDPDPDLNWTLVAPHAQNTAGWWHTGFFVLAAGLFAGLGALVGLRLRRSATDAQLRGLVESGWLAATAFCALGFVSLAAADNLAADETQAGLATAGGVLLATLVFTAGVVWAFRFRLGAIGPSLLLGLSAALGLGLLSLNGLQAPVGVGLIGTLIAATAGVGLVATAFASAGEAPGAERIGRLANAAAVALLATLTLLGSLSVALHLVADHGLEAALVVLAGAAVTTVAVDRSGRSAANLLLRATAIAYSIGLVVLAGWIAADGTREEANDAAGFAAFFLDGLVLGMIRKQFAQMIRSDILGGDESGRRTEEVGTETLIQVFAFGLAALAALATLFSVSAPLLGLDTSGGFPDLDYRLLGVGLALALAFVAAGAIRAQIVDPLRRSPASRPRSADDTSIEAKLAADPVAASLVIGGAAVWIATLLWCAIKPGPQMIAAAAVGACLIGVMASEDVVRSCTRVQLHSPNRLSLVVALVVGATVAASLFFVLAAGLWDGEVPASAAASVVSLAIPTATVFVAWLIASPVAFGLTTEKLTPQSPSMNVLLIQGLYAGLALIALILPMMVVGRIQAIDPADAGLVAVTSLAVLPPLIGAFVWVLGNNSLHLESQIRKAEEGENLPEAIASRERLDRWTAWMSTHIRFQNRFSVGVMLAGFTWMTVAILA